MTVSRILSRLNSVVQNTLDGRASSHDDVEWEVALGMMQTEEDVILVVNVYICLSRLDDQDCGIETKVLNSLPLDVCTNEFLAEWVDEAWDLLVLRGMEVLTFSSD